MAVIVLLFAAYLCWRVWLSVRRLDPMPWEGPMLIFVLLAGLSGLIQAAVLLPDAVRWGVNALVLAGSCVIAYLASRKYNKWCAEQREKRENQTKHTN